VLRRIFGAERREVARCWGILHNEELHNFHSSPDIIRVMKSETMGSDHLEGLGIDRTVLEWILQE
jgi:hypothetical protein